MFCTCLMIKIQMSCCEEKNRDDLRIEKLNSCLVYINFRLFVFATKEVFNCMGNFCAGVLGKCGNLKPH